MRNPVGPITGQRAAISFIRLVLVVRAPGCRADSNKSSRGRAVADAAALFARHDHGRLLVRAADARGGDAIVVAVGAARAVDGGGYESLLALARALPFIVRSRAGIRDAGDL